MKAVNKLTSKAIENLASKDKGIRCLMGKVYIYGLRLQVEKYTLAIPNYRNSQCIFK